MPQYTHLIDFTGSDSEKISHVNKKIKSNLNFLITKITNFS